MNKREYKQITGAIEAMHFLNIAGYGEMVSRHNVISIITTHLEGVYEKQTREEGE